MTIDHDKLIDKIIKKCKRPENEDSGVKESFILLLDSLYDKNHYLYKYAQQLMTLLNQEEIPETPTDDLIKLFQSNEIFDFIIPEVRKILNFGIQKDNQCITELLVVKKLLIIKNKSITFIDKIISFLKKKTDEIYVSDMTSLILSVQYFDDDNVKAQILEISNYLDLNVN